MNLPNVNFALPAADKTTVQTSLQTVKGKLPFLINLNPEQRKSARKMGAKRRSYVNDVFSLATSNPSAMPSGFDMAAFTKNHQLWQDVYDIIEWISPIWEGLNDTETDLGNEIIQQADEAYGHLKISAKKNPTTPISIQIKNISDQLKYGKRKPKTPPLPPITPIK
jgi:ABC-type molybdate transport system substrate-binding protein